MISSIRIMFFSLPLRTFMLGRNLFRQTEKKCFLVSNVVAECLKIKDILRTFYPQFCKILRTSRGKNFFPGPYIKKKCICKLLLCFSRLSSSIRHESAPILKFSWVSCIKLLHISPIFDPDSSIVLFGYWLTRPSYVINKHDLRAKRRIVSVIFRALKVRLLTSMFL